ncbi:MAG: M56 family metallopeptidase [Planctomycetota bacterium]|jgi:bla regulator protein BlaR1
MEAFLGSLATFFNWLLSSTAQVSILILLIVAVQLLLRRRLETRWFCLLWIIVVIRMIMPWAPQSRFSVFNLLPDFELYQQAEPVVDNARSSDSWSYQPVISVGYESSTPTSPGDAGYPKPKPATIQIARQAPSTSVLADITANHLPAIIWLAGAMLFLSYLLFANFRLWRIVLQVRPLTDQKVLNLLEDCKSRMGIRTVLAIVVTDKVKSPALFGFIRPRLLLPKGLIETLSHDELGHIFLHELAHLKRFDIYLGWLTSLMQILHWFNPLVWYAFYRLRSDRELACDRLAIASMTEHDPQKYGHTIIRLLERFSYPQYLPAMAGILEGKSFLNRRMNMIRKFRGSNNRWSVLGIAMLAAIGCTALTDARSPSAPKNIQAKVAHLDIDRATTDDVIEIFGEPQKYLWKTELFKKYDLPERFIMDYTDEFRVFISNNRIVELRFESPESGYLFRGKLKVGSTLAEVKKVIGEPEKIITGNKLEFAESALYKDIDGKKGYCYYHRPDQKIRMFFLDYKVTALYVTRSDYHDGPSKEKVVLESSSKTGPNGRIIDKIDYPFVNDPQAIGQWKSVDFVTKIEDFNPKVRRWAEKDLFLKGFVIIDKGRVSPGWYNWTKGLIIHANNRTAAKYHLKQFDGSTYMFFEWKSGDYSIRHMKPHYYVLKKLTSDTGSIGRAWAKLPTDAEFARQLPEKVAKLSINKAKLDDVIKFFGEPGEYSWGKKNFDKEFLPEDYIMEYPNNFSIWMKKGRIEELRVRRPGYRYRNKLEIGSSMDETLKVLGKPAKTVQGKKNEFADGVLYKDIEGRKGYGYYARKDQGVRVFFQDNKLKALFMTRTEPVETGQ